MTLDDRLRLVAQNRADRVFEKCIKQGFDQKTCRFQSNFEYAKALVELRAAHPQVQSCR